MPTSEASFEKSSYTINRIALKAARNKRSKNTCKMAPQVIISNVGYNYIAAASWPQRDGGWRGKRTLVLPCHGGLVAHNIEYDMVSHWKMTGFRSFCSQYYAPYPPRQMQRRLLPLWTVPRSKRPFFCIYKKKASPLGRCSNALRLPCVVVLLLVPWPLGQVRASARVDGRGFGAPRQVGCVGPHPPWRRRRKRASCVLHSGRLSRVRPRTTHNGRAQVANGL